MTEPTPKPFSRVTLSAERIAELVAATAPLIATRMRAEEIASTLGIRPRLLSAIRHLYYPDSRHIPIKAETIRALVAAGHPDSEIGHRIGIPNRDTISFLRLVCGVPHSRAFTLTHMRQPTKAQAAAQEAADRLFNAECRRFSERHGSHVPYSFWQY